MFNDYLMLVFPILFIKLIYLRGQLNELIRNNSWYLIYLS